jgi:hypothetical protein
VGVAARPAAAEALRELAPELADGFAAADTEDVAVRLRRLRSRLRAWHPADRQPSTLIP